MRHGIGAAAHRSHRQAPRAGRALLARLTPRQRTLLQLRVLTDPYSAEVAEELGMRPETVCREVQRARAAFGQGCEAVMGEDAWRNLRNLRHRMF